MVLQLTYGNTGLGHLDGHPIRHGGLRGALLAEGGVEYKVPVKSSEKTEYVNEAKLFSPKFLRHVREYADNLNSNLIHSNLELWTHDYSVHHVRGHVHMTSAKFWGF